MNYIKVSEYVPRMRPVDTFWFFEDMDSMRHALRESARFMADKGSPRCHVRRASWRKIIGLPTIGDLSERDTIPMFEEAQ